MIIFTVYLTLEPFQHQGNFVRSILIAK